MQRSARGSRAVRAGRLKAPSPDNHLVGVLVPVLASFGILAFDVFHDDAPQYLGLVSAMPLLAAALTGPLRTAFVGTVIAAMAFLTGFFQFSPPDIPVATQQPHQLRVAYIVVMGVLAVGLSVARRRKAEHMRRLSSVADAAQQAILRPLPEIIGPLRCASTYQSATSYAQIGGDLVEVLDTAFGVRAVIGDVRGKGMEAVRLGGRVLGSFRENAWTAPDLPELAARLDLAVRRDAGPEDFVTAALVEIADDGSVIICTCGHPAPYLVGPGFSTGPAREVDVAPGPPLGLLDELPQVTSTHLREGERMVLVTDGLLESRRRSRLLSRAPDRFLPAEAVLGAALARGPMRAGLDHVLADVRAWTRGRMSDDLAMLVLEHRGRRLSDKPPHRERLLPDRSAATNGRGTAPSLGGGGRLTR